MAVLEAFRLVGTSSPIDADERLDTWGGLVENDFARYWFY